METDHYRLVPLEIDPYRLVPLPGPPDAITDRLRYLHDEGWALVALLPYRPGQFGDAVVWEPWGVFRRRDAGPEGAPAA